MPSLIKPLSKRKGKPAVTSAVWHIRYYCPSRRRSVVISTRCKGRKNAEARLREFADLLERGEVGTENPFLARPAELPNAALYSFDARLRLIRRPVLPLPRTDRPAGQSQYRSPDRQP